MQQDHQSNKPRTPSTETNTTLTTTTTYLSTHLIVPYFVTPNGTIKRPEYLIAWWSRIFSFYVPDDKDHIQLRFLCRLFRDALIPPPLYTTFPHPKYPTLNGLMDKLNNVYQKDPTKAPKIVFVLKGTFRVKATATYNNEAVIIIKYPLKIIGAGQNKTIIHGGGFSIPRNIHGKNKNKGIVELSRMTVRRMISNNGLFANGLFANQGLSFVCRDMTFTQCGAHGVCAFNATGRLINCVITQCSSAGIISGCGGLIEVEGSRTKVEKNGTSKGSYYKGLFVTSGSSIHLLSPLTKENVSTNNWKNQNYGGGGTIQTVGVFER
jgi:hypothetical protein